MMCYRDMTFCAFNEECKDGPTCPRALTKKVRDDAEKWWGGPGAPIAMFMNYPGCFVKLDGTKQKTRGRKKQ